MRSFRACVMQVCGAALRATTPASCPLLSSFHRVEIVVVLADGARVPERARGPRPGADPGARRVARRHGIVSLIPLLFVRLLLRPPCFLFQLLHILCQLLLPHLSTRLTLSGIPSRDLPLFANPASVLNLLFLIVNRYTELGCIRTAMYCCAAAVVFRNARAFSPGALADPHVRPS